MVAGGGFIGEPGEIRTLGVFPRDTQKTTTHLGLTQVSGPYQRYNVRKLYRMYFILNTVQGLQ